MRHVPSLALLALLTTSSACGGDTAAPDAGGVLDAFELDAASARDVGAGEDASGEDAATAAMDDAASPVADDAAPSSEDAGTDAPASALDAGADATSTTDAPTTASLGPVQCAPSMPCGLGAGFCNETAPGGVCMCGGASDCPSGTSCDSDFGVCVRDCRTSADCSAGMGCVASTCRALRCSDAAPCPAPYVCSSSTSGLCQRPSCSGGARCPAPMRCDRSVCVEP